MSKKDFVIKMARGKAAKKYGIPLSNVCPVCFGVMRDVWENNGFQAPNPTHEEVTGVKCLTCGYGE